MALSTVPLCNDRTIAFREGTVLDQTVSALNNGVVTPIFRAERCSDLVYGPGHYGVLSPSLILIFQVNCMLK